MHGTNMKIAVNILTSSGTATFKAPVFSAIMQRWKVFPCLRFWDSYWSHIHRLNDQMSTSTEPM